MKKLVLIAFLLFYYFNNIEAQEVALAKSDNSFIEWNFGLAYINKDIIFPGTSVLWGSTHINENNSIVEYEVGMALPSLVTGKIGVGQKFGNTKVIAGIRPFPFNFYLQSSIAKCKKGYWITSVEFNPIDSEQLISFGSKAILNFGYRWNLSKSN